jgi:xylulokinase
MLLLGLDIGTSSIKASVVDATTQQCIASANYPETEREIISVQHGWAEQSPLQWWFDVQQVILKLHESRAYDSKDIGAIGISYQMHGLVLVDKRQDVLRDSIIWCDSRAVEIGNAAFEKIGEEKCLTHLLNSPGNFTASKLAWVKENEPEIFAQIHKIMLPGDFIAMKFTDEITTSISSLSEGVFWDFKENQLSKDVFDYFGIDTSLIPTIKNVFTEHGRLSSSIASDLSLKAGIPVTYKAGDQPNNALSLNVFNPCEVAATAGTSGVIYSVTDKLVYDKQSRVNTFAHVNHTIAKKRLGVLLCINGTGILNRWMKNIAGEHFSYAQMNELAKGIAVGSEGVMVFPFGNGAERMLNNANVGTHIHNIDLNKHGKAHLFRAAQEAIAFAFRYGLDILRENGIEPDVIRAGKANMFLSEVFTDSFVNATKTPVQLYGCNGSAGAAIGAGIGVGVYASVKEAFTNFKPLNLIEPTNEKIFEELYGRWKEQLELRIKKD